MRDAQRDLGDCCPVPSSMPSRPRTLAHSIIVWLVLHGYFLYATYLAACCNVLETSTFRRNGTLKKYALHCIQYALICFGWMGGRRDGTSLREMAFCAPYPYSHPKNCTSFSSANILSHQGKKTLLAFRAISVLFCASWCWKCCSLSLTLSRYGARSFSVCFLLGFTLGKVKMSSNVTLCILRVISDILNSLLKWGGKWRDGCGGIVATAGYAISSRFQIFLEGTSNYTGSSSFAVSETAT